jgi:hypothetical protein
MIFREITPSRFRVLAHEGDTKFRGVVEKHTFRDEKGITRSWWLARGADAGWKVSTKGKFKTRKAAGEALLEDNEKAYGDRRMSWKKKQGTTVGT